MKIVASLVCSSLLAAVLWGIWSERSRPSTSFTFSVDHPATGRVSVALNLSGLDADILELTGLLSDELMRVSDFRATDEGGRVLEFKRIEGAERFTRYLLDLGGVSAVRIEYRVEPSAYLPPNGEIDFRRCATVVAGGCALSLANLVLIPSMPLSSVALEARLPEGWKEVVSLPQKLEVTGPESWWDVALVAGRYRDGTQVSGCSARISLFEQSSEEVADALADVLRELQRMFGPPRGLLHVALAPFADSVEPVELPGWARPTVIDLRSVDAGSLARVIRTLVPAWFGRRPAELDNDRSPEGWFALGLSEFLALALPGRLGLARSQATRIERQWVLGERGVDLESAKGVAPQARRQAAAACLHELARTWPSGERLEDSLQGYSGSGYPVFSPRDQAAFSSFLEAVVRDRSRKLSFERDWHFELSEAPHSTDVSVIARVLDIAFTAETNGYLESCGCKQSQSGGVAQRAKGLADLRADRPGLLLFDLGNFSPLEEGFARLEPLVEEELHVFVEALVRTGYDGISMGPREFYCGSQWLRQEAQQRIPALGLGLLVAGQAPYPGSTIVERSGLRVGFIAFSGLDEGSLTLEINEIHMDGVSFPDSLEPLLAEARRLRQQVDVLIVGGRMPPTFLRELCASDVGVDLVLLSGLFEDERPQGLIAGFQGDTAVALDVTSYNGFNTVKLALNGANRPVAVDCQPSFIDQAAPADPRVKSLIDDFNANLADRADLVAGMKPLFAWDTWQRDDFVGAAACTTCHLAEHEQWRQTPHSKAMTTLAGIRRDRHPKCVQCHVVGFESTTGYRISAPDPRFAGVQCETCHGSGGEHVKNPREGHMRRTPPQKVCLECHDPEHSDKFEARFGQAWAAILHTPPSSGQ